MGRWLLSRAGVQVAFVKAVVQHTQNLQQQRQIGGVGRPPSPSSSSLLLFKGKVPMKTPFVVIHGFPNHYQIGGLRLRLHYMLHDKSFWVNDDGSHELTSFSHLCILCIDIGVDDDDDDDFYYHHPHQLGSSLRPADNCTISCSLYDPHVVRVLYRGRVNGSSLWKHQTHHHHHPLHHPTARAYHAMLIDFCHQDYDPSQGQKAEAMAKRMCVSTNNEPSHQAYSSSHKLQGGMRNFPSHEFGGTCLSHQHLKEGGLGLSPAKRMCVSTNNEPSHQAYSSSYKLQRGMRNFPSHEFGGTCLSHQHLKEGGLGLSPGLCRDGSHLHCGNKEILLQDLCQKGQLDKALSVLSSVNRALPSNLYLSLFKLCNKSKALNQAKQIHGHIVQNNVPITGFLGDYLVMALAKCGAIEDACHISATLPQRTVFSWTAMISAKVDAGCIHEALKMFQSMQEEGIEPNNYTFVSLFKACGITRNLLKGKDLHEAAYRKGFVSDVFVCSALVSFYNKCGAIVEAEDVFCSSPQSDVVSWNAMLAAYVEHEEAIQALKMYRQMQEEGVRPDQLTLVLILQACGALAEKGEFFAVEGGSTREIVLRIGRALHADASRFIPSLFVHNTLVSMYGKCEAVVEAEHVFGAISQRSIVSWNAMLAAYLHEGECEKVLLLFRQMHKEGISPVQRTFLFAIQACGNLAEKVEALYVEGQPMKVTALMIGQALHIDARKNNFESDTFVGTSLLSMYGKCGAIMEAEDIFVAMPYRDKISWNAMLSMYIEQGHGEKALKLYRQMYEVGSTPDKVGIMLALQACCILIEKEGESAEEVESIRVMSIEIGESLHANARQRGFALDVHLGSILLRMYARLGAVLSAENVFITFSQRDVVLWSVMLSAYVEQGLGGRALQFFQQMLREGVSPDPHALVYALQACITLTEQEITVFIKELSTKSIALEMGQALHAEARSRGFTSNPHVGNALVSMYGKCGAFQEAEDVFGASTQVNIISWNAMLSVYIEHGLYDKVLWLHTHIQEHMDDVTLVCILQACRLAGNLEVCTHLHFGSASAGCDQILSVAASLIHAYGNCAGMLDAQALFHGLLRPDLVSWNAHCDGHTGGGDFVGSLGILENLELAGTKPDDITFISVLSVCSHTGFVREGLEYFESMTRDYDIIASLKHYGNLVDLLGRAGDFKRIENMMAKMPMQVSFPMWLCLLGSCSTHGNIELARRAFDHAVKLQPKQIAAYIVMSNIYIDAGLQGSAEEVENLRLYHGASEASEHGNGY